LLIARMLDRTPTISGLDSVYPLQGLEYGLGAPKTTATKNSGF
jgi:hypothetical protein